MRLRFPPFAALGLLFFSGIILSQSQKPSRLRAETPHFGVQARGWLTVDTIMQDPKWMGTSPTNVFWSEDGAWVYFN